MPLHPCPLPKSKVPITKLTRQQFVREWVAALRSGKFAQTTGRLHKTPDPSGVYGHPTRRTYCCLGVACEVARAHGSRLAARDLGRDGVVPRDWLKKFLGSTDPELRYSKAAAGRVRASVLNDRKKLSFRQIASAIERTFLTPTPAPTPKPRAKARKKGAAQ